MPIQPHRTGARPTRSTWILFFRAFVMCVCLVVLPLWAVLGTRLPSIIQSSIQRLVPPESAPLKGPEAAQMNPQPISQAGPFSLETQPARAPARDQAMPQPLLPPKASENTRSDGPAVPERSDFRHIERQLRELGATYYLLERWGEQDGLYRFQCRVAVTDDAQLVRHFEATGSQPLDAMRTVLGDIQSWRSGVASLPSGRGAVH